MQVVGVDGLARALKLLGKSIGRKVAHAALKKGAAPIVTEARARAPKADGELKKKTAKGERYTLQPGEGARSIKARVSTGRRGPKDPTVSVGPDQDHFYLKFFESGFTVGLTDGDRKEHKRTVTARGKAKRQAGIEAPAESTGKGTFIPPRPFLRPAFDHNAEAAIQIVGRELGRRVEIEAAKLAAKQGKP